MSADSETTNARASADTILTINQLYIFTGSHSQNYGGTVCFDSNHNESCSLECFLLQNMLCGFIALECDGFRLVAVNVVFQLVTLTVSRNNAWCHWHY